MAKKEPTAGIVLVLATQRPDSKTIPSGLRAVLGEQMSTRGYGSSRLLASHKGVGRRCSPPAPRTASQWRSTPGRIGWTRPRRLLRLAVDIGCVFAIDSGTHAPGQLYWQPYGCERAEECGITADRAINTKGADDLLA